MSHRLSALGSEVRRQASSRLTHQVLLRRGTDLGMWLGCGYPKSGTVWLCHLMASALEIPYPQNYEMPVMMRSVIHSHWNHDERLPKTIYIYRDGRDVLTSLYFYLTKSGKPQRNPVAMMARRRRGHSVEGILGAGDQGAQMLRLLEMEMEHPTGADSNWADHVRQWRGREDVAVVAYEDLLTDPVPTMSRAFAELGHQIEPRLMEASVQLHDFSLRTGRKPGDSVESSFRRSGVSGGWREHFTPELARAFDDYAGDLLVDLGYEQDRTWARSIG